jgi:hypothetical protein
VERKKDNFDVWKNRVDARGGLQAIRVRHVNVEDHYVGMGQLCLRYSFRAVASFADDAAMQFCEQQPANSPADQFMVVSDKNSKPSSTSTH